MAITALDPETALILIDLQKGIVAYPTVHQIGSQSSAKIEIYLSPPRRRTLWQSLLLTPKPLLSSSICKKELWLIRPSIRSEANRQPKSKSIYLRREGELYGNHCS